MLVPWTPTCWKRPCGLPDFSIPQQRLLEPDFWLDQISIPATDRTSAVLTVATTLSEAGIELEALKAAEALKDEFISLATHELRTPVTVLAGYADLLLRGTRRGTGHALDEQRHKVQAMKEAARGLTKLAEDLLDVTRLQAGKLALHPCPTEIRLIFFYLIYSRKRAVGV